MRLPKHRPPTHPGEILFEDFLKPYGLSQKEFAERAGMSYPRVNELIHAKRGVTPDTALRLAKLLNTTAAFWLNGQLAYDLYHAMHSPQAKSIETLEPITNQ